MATGRLIPGGPVIGLGPMPPPPKKPAKAKKPLPPLTGAQLRALKAWERAHPFTKGFKKPKPRPHTARARGAVMPPALTDWRQDCSWVLGGNDTYDTCTMTALANQQLVGLRGHATDEEIIAAGENLSIDDAFRYVGEYGLDGLELRAVYSASPRDAAVAGGLVLGLNTAWGPHTVVTLGGGKVVSWGRVLPLTALAVGTWPTQFIDVEEAWAVEWR